MINAVGSIMPVRGITPSPFIPVQPRRAEPHSRRRRSSSDGCYTWHDGVRDARHRHHEHDRHFYQGFLYHWPGTGIKEMRTNMYPRWFDGRRNRVRSIRSVNPTHAIKQIIESLNRIRGSIPGWSGAVMGR